MAVTIGGSFGTYLTRNTGLPLGTDFTIMAWVRLFTPIGSPVVSIYASLTDDYSNPYCIAYFTPEGYLDLYDGVDWYQTKKQAIATRDQWFHFVLVCNNDTYTIYGSTQDKTTFDVITMDRITQSIGLTPEFLQIYLEETSAIKELRVWTTALSEAEIRAERNSATTVKTANLYSDTPLSDTSDINDISGNGNDWTFDIDGTFTNYAAPIVPLSPTIVSSIPVTYNEATIGEGASFEKWYQYTASADVLLGMIAFADITSNFLPTIDVFAGDATDPFRMNPVWAPMGIGSWDIALATATQRPVETPIKNGQTYYFRVTQKSGGSFPLNADLMVKFDFAPTAGIVPVNSIFITDDTDYFPAALLSATNGEVIKFIDIRASEFGTTLPSGHMCLSYGLYYEFGSWVAVYDSNFSLIAAPFADAYGPLQISHNGTNAFFIAHYDDNVNVQIAKLDILGNLELAKWVLPLATAYPFRIFTVNWTETILYYAKPTGAIHRWDLVNDVALPDFTTITPGALEKYGRDFITLADGSMIYSIRPTVDWVGDSYVYRYDAAGNLLNTYGPFVGFVDRMAAAADDPTSFWIWADTLGADGFTEPPLSRFRNIQTSDGTILADFSKDSFQAGQGHRWDPLWADGDAPFFQHSYSCSLMVVRSVTQVGGIYILVPGKRDDTLWTSFSPLASVDVKIPNPFARTALLGE